MVPSGRQRPRGGDRANEVELNERFGRSGGYVLELLTKPHLENIGAFLRPISQQCPLSRKGLSAFFVSCAEKIACVFCGPWFVNSPVSRRLSVKGPTGATPTTGLAVGGVCVESCRRRRKRRPRKNVGLPPCGPRGGGSVRGIPRSKDQSGRSGRRSCPFRGGGAADAKKRSPSAL